MGSVFGDSSRQINELADKRPCRAATQGNCGNLAGGAPLVVDGVTLRAKDRVLVKCQTMPARNGVYTVVVPGDGASGIWSRARDFNKKSEVYAGASIYIAEGIKDGGTTFYLTTPGDIALGVTELEFSRDDVISGPGSSTDMAVVRWSGTTGGIIQDSVNGPIVNDDGVTNFKSGVVHTHKSVTADDSPYTVRATDYLLGIKTGTGSIRIALPSAGSVSKGQTYVIVDEGGASSTNAITVDPASSETISGEVTFTMDIPYSSIQVYSNGAAWFII